MIGVTTKEIGMKIDFTNAAVVCSNVRKVESDGIIYLAIDPKVNLGPSKSRKTLLVATSNGQARIGDMDLNLNLYRKNPDYKP